MTTKWGFDKKANALDLNIENHNTMKVEHINLNNKNIGNHMTDFINKESKAGTTVQKESEVLHFFAVV